MQAEERKLVVTWRVLLQAGSDIADKFEPQLCEVAWEQLKGLLGRTRNAVQLEVFLEEEETATSSTTSSSEIWRNWAHSGVMSTSGWLALIWLSRVGYF